MQTLYEKTGGDASLGASPLMLPNIGQAVQLECSRVGPQGRPTTN